MVIIESQYCCVATCIGCSISAYVSNIGRNFSEIYFLLGSIVSVAADYRKLVYGKLGNTVSTCSYITCISVIPLEVRICKGYNYIVAICIEAVIVLKYYSVDLILNINVCIRIDNIRCKNCTVCINLRCPA